MNGNTDCKTRALSVLTDGVLSRTSPHSARNQGRLSRRACLAVLAGSASVVLKWSIVQAQEVVWREFRRNDAGFRIEMPGVPTVEDDKGLPTDPWIRMINAGVEYEQISFGLIYAEYKQHRSEEEWFREFARGVSASVFKIVAETPLTMNGFQGREIIVESAELKLDAVYRTFVLNNSAFVSLSATGPVANPNIRRFLDSFMLFRS
jgi:hypothetical protein